MNMKIKLSDLVRMVNEAIMEAVPQQAPPTPLPKKNMAPPTPLPKANGAPTPLPKAAGAPVPFPKAVNQAADNGVQQVSQISPAELKSTIEDIFDGENDENADLLSTQTDVGQTRNGFRPAIIGMKYQNFYEGMDAEENNKESLKLFLGFVTNQTREKIVKAINTNYDGIVIAKNITEKDAVNDDINPEGVNKNCDRILKLAIYPGKNQDFINIADNIVNLFYSFMPSTKGKTPAQIAAMSKAMYDPSFKPTFAQRLKDFVNKSVSDGDIEKANIRIAENWVNLLSDLSNPDVIKKIGKIQVLYGTGDAKRGPVNGENVFGDNGKAAGWQFSFKNKQFIFSQDPNATYVCEEFVWRDYYNHEVIDRNKFILVQKPSFKTVTAKDMNDAAIDRGYQGGNNEFKALKGRKEVTSQEGNAVLNMAKFLAQPGTTVRFELVKMYDVANTRPIPGMESKFLPGENQERGLINNLEGIPNDAARKAIQQPEQDTAPEEVVQQNSEEKLELIKDALIEVVRHLTGTGGPDETGDKRQDIINFTYAYANFVQTGALSTVARDETTNAFNLGFSAAVSYAIGVPNDEAADYLNRSLHNVNIGKDAKLKDLIIQWHKEYVEFMKMVLKNANAKIKNAIKSGELSADTQKIAEGMENGMSSLGVHIMSLPEFEKLFGIDDNEQIYEEEDVETSPEVIQESFFRFLDRMDYNGRI